MTPEVTAIRWAAVTRATLLLLAGVAVLTLASGCGNGSKRNGLPGRTDPEAAQRLLACAKRSGLDLRVVGPLLNVYSHAGQRLTGTILFYRDVGVARKAISESRTKKTGPAWAVASMVYFGTKSPAVDKRVRACLAEVS
jgi:hypothetical protein